MSEPFLAVTPADLGEPLGSTVVCPHCGETHAVQVSVSDTPRSARSAEPLTLEWYRCGETTYAAGLNGLALRDWGGQ